jgi:hypothetical protein
MCTHPGYLFGPHGLFVSLLINRFHRIGVHEVKRDGPHNPKRAPWPPTCGFRVRRRLLS